jgi:uncharacterized protein YceK
MRAVTISLLLVFLTGGCEAILGLKDPQRETASDAAPGADAMAADSNSAKCVPAQCPFGCDTQTDACRAGKLWIFATVGLTLGNAFGGADVPPNVRGGADARCLSTYTSTYTNRSCSNANVHAILYVNATDGLAQMSSRYSIPASVPLHRATDDVLVADTWNDLIDVSKQPKASATNIPTETDGIFWSGANGTDTCKNWTSAASTDLGMRGYSTLIDVNWLRRDSFRCDRLSRLLCVCW